jgi:PAS domain S-box-containing protein
MNDRTAPQVALEQPPASYAGRTRFTQLEYEAVLANAWIGIAFTRDRKFFLCNPKFAEMLGWKPEELIGQPGEIVYPSQESYEALGRIAVPVLSAGKQLDLDWEVRRKDGSTFLARIIAKTISETDPRRGTVWIVDDVTDARRHGEQVARLLREQEAIFETASIGIVFVRDRRVARCNARFEQMHGYAPGELDRPADLGLLRLREADRARMPEVYARLRSGEHVEEVVARVRKDGSPFTVRAVGRAIDPSDPQARRRCGSPRTSPSSAARRPSCSACSPSRRRCSTTSWWASPSRASARCMRCNRRFEETLRLRAGRRERRLGAPDLLHGRGVRGRGGELPSSSTAAARTCASSGCAARTARGSGAACRAARCRPATRRAVRCGCSRTSPSPGARARTCAARSPSSS